MVTRAYYSIIFMGPPTAEFFDTLKALADRDKVEILAACVEEAPDHFILSFMTADQCQPFVEKIIDMLTPAEQRGQVTFSIKPGEFKAMVRPTKSH